MPVHRVKATAQRAGRDRRDVIDEPLRRDLGELGRHVAAHGRDVVALRRERRVEHPIAVRALLQRLFAGLRIDRAHRVVRATERNRRAVRRPAQAVNRVVRHRHREPQFALLDLPNLNLPHAPRLPTGHREGFAIRRKPHRLDALGKPDQPRREARAIGLVQQHLVKTRDREHLPIRRIIQRRDDRRHRVHRQMILIVPLPHIGRRVVVRALGEPLFEQLDFQREQRRLALRHLGFAFGIRHDLHVQQALVGIAREHRRGLVLAVAAREELREIRHHVAALRLGRLMATLTIGLQNGANLLVVTDRPLVLLRLRRRRRGGKQRRHRE